MVIPANEVLDKEDLGTDEAGALSVVTPYSGALSFHYPYNEPEENRMWLWFASTETFARYTHTLMVRGRQSGVIRFTASNNRTSPARSGQLTITCKFSMYTHAHYMHVLLP